MKNLLLCRHADAQPLSGRQSDMERKLSEAGMVQCEQAINWLYQLQISGLQIFCSSAERAFETAKLLATAFPGVRPQVYDELYESSSSGLLKFVNNLPEPVQTVLLVSHNPGISYFASNLCDRDLNFETCQIVELDLAANKWEEVSYGAATAKKVFVTGENLP